MPPSQTITACYFCTSDDVVQKRLSKSIRAQIGHKAGSSILSSTRVLATDDSHPISDDMVKDFFGPNIVRCDPYDLDSAGSRHLNLSKLRNAGLQAARHIGQDWLTFNDADTVVVDVPELTTSNPYCVPNVYWQRSQLETLDQSIENIETEGRNAFSQGNSWFMLHRSVLENHDFNEKLYGYGFEDLDFDARLGSRGIRLAQAGGTIVHMFHPHEERQIVAEVFRRNELIFEANKIVWSLNNEVGWRSSSIIEEGESLYVYYASINLIVDPLRRVYVHPSWTDKRCNITWSNERVDDFAIERFSTLPAEISSSRLPANSS